MHLCDGMTFLDEIFLGTDRQQPLAIFVDGAALLSDLQDRFNVFGTTCRLEIDRQMLDSHLLQYQVSVLVHVRLSRVVLVAILLQRVLL